MVHIMWLWRVQAHAFDVVNLHPRHFLAKIEREGNPQLGIMQHHAETHPWLAAPVEVIVDIIATDERAGREIKFGRGMDNIPNIIDFIGADKGDVITRVNKQQFVDHVGQSLAQDIFMQVKRLAHKLRAHDEIFLFPDQVLTIHLDHRHR